MDLRCFRSTCWKSHIVEGHLPQTWLLNVASTRSAGLGPFRLKQYLPGQRIVLERNPYYWKIDRDNERLPYLDELVFLFVGSEDAQVMRFEAGETQVISRLSSDNYKLLSREPGAHAACSSSTWGPAWNTTFWSLIRMTLVSKKLDAIAHKQVWFRDIGFRQAVSAAVDRESIVRLVYGTRGAPLWGNVGPGNKLWVNPGIPHPKRSLDNARQLLKSAGFSWNRAGELTDSTGRAAANSRSSQARPTPNA